MTDRPIRDTPNVVTEIQLKALLEHGWGIEVAARADPVLKQSFWSGEWIIRVVNEDGDEERALVPTRAGGDLEIKLRLFKTPNGLITFLYGLGFPAATVPMRAGETALHRASDRNVRS
ncbi:hypothetical protein [Jannaschia aquimarina]|uniref:Uncharacterized protein n=1 Tax=Jannaschia aquimarina TaxID=935700 RepID=A0A0D1EFW2_9RHOB|nr:hypothetical protein [Jannaschia aquimarina]KIT16579.1 hypothetical protein jaqu_16740 [Jannaschia aquimarina]SNT41580.1 hypothetical protein SAMN05421775_11719 [Jannaschia aquimarina]